MRDKFLYYDKYSTVALNMVESLGDEDLNGFAGMVKAIVKQLEQVPEKELKKKLKKKQKFVIKLLIILAALAAILAVIVFRAQYIEPRDARADYLWEKENFPVLDRLYREQDFEGLTEFYEQAVIEDRTIGRWEHSGIFTRLMSCRNAREYLALEQSGETLRDYQETQLLDDYSKYLLLIAEHSKCQPGRPKPHGLSQPG